MNDLAAPTAFKFEHLGDLHTFRDMRRQPAAQIAWAHCYFAGFRVTTTNGDRYHHAMFIADSHAAFLNAISAESQRLVDYVTVKSRHDVKVVFIHNLVVYDPTLHDAESHYQAVVDQVHPLICDFDDQYVLIGVSLQHGFHIFNEQADTALHVMDDAKVQVLAQHRECIKSLLVCQAHPVTLEFYALMEQAVERFKFLLGAMSAESASVH